jgi:general secretion pathway protein D
MAKIKPIAWLCAAAMLSGCAAEREYKDGKDLVAQDKVELGLVKFQQAMADDPANFEYKAAYMQTRERAVAAYATQADALAQAGKQAEAEALYQRALAIDPSNTRVRDGLQALAAAKRHAQWFKEAQAAIAHQDTATAQFKLDMILTEDPGHAGAKALKKTLAERLAKPTVDQSLANAFKKPISIEFRDAQLKQVFEVIAMSSGLNFVFDKEIKTDQKTSIYLKNSTVEAAIYMLLITNQLEQQILDDNTILIYPNTQAKQKEYQQLVVKSFYLTNADAKTVANTIKTIIKSRDIVTDERVNMVIVRDTPEAMKLVEKLVALHDVPEPEVMLEVEVLEVSRTRLMELGIQWPNSLTLAPILPTVSQDPTNGTPISGQMTLNNLRHLNGNTLAAAISPVVVNARKEDGDSNILANPRIRVRNHEKAKILIGDRVPNITTTIGAGASSFVSESINYVDVGLKLEVEPTIYLDNDVAIRIGLEVSNIVSQLQTKSGSVAYQIGTRNANTVLRLKDGETQILAGLINDQDRKSANKVPGLGDLPIVGRLFGSQLDNNEKTEIVLSITPHLIRNIQRPSAVAAEFRSGTETSFRGAPESPARGNAAPINGGHITQTTPQIAAPVMTAPATNTATPAANSAASTAAPSTAAPGAAAPEASGKGVFLQWAGPSVLKVGDPFDMKLVLESQQPVSDLAMTVGFDTKALQVTGVTEGDFLKQGGAQTTFASQVDPGGQVVIKAKRASDGGLGGASGPGPVATISFRAIAPADSAKVQLNALTPADANGKAIATPSLAPYSIRIQK